VHSSKHEFSIRQKRESDSNATVLRELLWKMQDFPEISTERGMKIDLNAQGQKHFSSININRESG
jgi:hypothetical protein